MRLVPRTAISLAVGFLCGAAMNAQDRPSDAQTPAPGAPHNNVRPAIRWKQFPYTCEGGAKVTLDLNDDTLAKLTFQGHQYLMKPTHSADGNRYSDGQLVWWGKGDGGFLQEDTPDGSGKMLAIGCRLIKPAAAQTSIIRGTVSYMQRIALPPFSAIEVQLLDITPANTPTAMPWPLIAEQKITLGQRQVPIPFALRFDAGKIDPKHSYALKASITVGNEIRFLTNQPHPVQIPTDVSGVDLVLQAASK